MILRIPDYFEDFHCLGGMCPDSCCVGWELDIDEATYDYYRSVPGAFGERLRSSIAMAEEDGETARTFCLKVDGRCPFLNDENLCEIVLRLGPEALSEVCTEYPRRTFVFGPYMTRSLTLSCPEVARMLLTSEPPVHFPEVDLAERVFANADAADAEGAEAPDAAFVANVRDRAIEILEDRGKPFAKRLRRYLQYTASVQEALENGDLTSRQLYNIEELSSAEADDARAAFAGADAYRFPETPDDARAAFAKRMELLEQLEVLTPRWEKELEALKTLSAAPPLPDFTDAVRAEHLMTYYTDRYFPRAWYDGDLLGKAGFAVFSLLVQMDMLALRARENGRAPSAADWIAAASLYAKEVENSEYNTELLLEELSAG